jgi:alanine racemase
MKKLKINKAQLVDNINKIKSYTGSTIIAALKNNGYGLGLYEYPKILLENGIDFFAVSTVEEALLLRSNGFINKVMLLHSTSLKEDISNLIAHDIILTIGSFEALEAINEAASLAKKPIPVQIKIDSGFGRFGFLQSDIKNLTKALISSSNLNIIGTFSHFTMSFNKNDSYTKKQFRIFKECVNILKQNGVNPGMIHICNSSAFLKYKEMHLDAVRIGSAFLGRILVDNTLKLNKIGELSSKIEDVKELQKNHYIGYSNTYKTLSDVKIGIIPVGYLDGFGLKKSQDCFRINDTLREMYSVLRNLNKKIFVKIGTKKVPVLGKIGTNNIVVKVPKDTTLSTEVLLEVNPMMVRPEIYR